MPAKIEVSQHDPKTEIYAATIRNVLDQFKMQVFLITYSGYLKYACSLLQSNNILSCQYSEAQALGAIKHNTFTGEATG